MNEKLMPFYDALKFLLTTASGNMITRRKWRAGGLIKVQVKAESTGEYKYIIHRRYKADYATVSMVYNATPEDMLAEDWYIIPKECI